MDHSISQASDQPIHAGSVAILMIPRGITIEGPIDPSVAKLLRLENTRRGRKEEIRTNRR